MSKDFLYFLSIILYANHFSHFYSAIQGTSSLEYRMSMMKTVFLFLPCSTFRTFCFYIHFLTSISSLDKTFKSSFSY
jgi:hypothetical protein